MFQIWTDSSCDLTVEELEALGVGCVPIALNVEMEDAGRTLEYPDKDGYSLSPDEFYDLQKIAEATKTSGVSVQDLLDAFRPVLEAGEDVLYVGIDPEMSEGSRSSAKVARDFLLAEYPGREIELPKTHSISGGLGLLVTILAEYCASGNVTMKAALAKVDELSRSVVHLFSVNNYDHLRKTGRVGYFVAGVGKALNLKPIMHLPRKGKLTTMDTVTGGKRALKRFAEMTADTIRDVSGEIWVCYGAAEERSRVEQYVELVKDATRLPDAKVSYHRIGPIIGAHTGPTVIAFFFVGIHR